MPPEDDPIDLDPTPPEGASKRAQDRIRELSSTVRSLRADLAETQSQLADADRRAKTAETLSGELRQVKEQLKAEKEARAEDKSQIEASFKVERAIMQAGITDEEGVEFARIAYDRLDADSRPDIAEWLAARDNLPKAVAAYLPAADDAPAPTPDPAPADGQDPNPADPPAEDPKPAAQTPPPENAGVVPTPGSPGQYSAAEIAKMSTEEYKAHKEQIRAGLTRGP